MKFSRSQPRAGQNMVKEFKLEGISLYITPNSKVYIPHNLLEQARYNPNKI
jgi:hypothetical protein